ILTNRYTHGSSVDEPLARTDLTTGANYFYHADALGSITAITDSSGAIIESYRYTSYGVPTLFDKDGIEISESAIGNFYLHTGSQYDSETKHYHHFYRERDASFGVWLSPDPLGFADGLNRYISTGDNPINYTDPLGLLKVHIWSYRGKSEAWGHASMTLDNADKTHISWWPDQPRDSKTLIPIVYSAPPRQPQLFKDDVRFEGQMPDFEVQITGLDEEKIEKWWKKFKKDNQWKTRGQNCSTTVADGLKAGGADKYASWWKSHNWLWTPNDVKDFADAIVNDLKEERSK
ncbi:MAG: RHS repeat-associated core domain-containing protein, partial [Chlamydiae bacterium]|nr:RHS repeat-associated core domain-containing protein [Chlamydiota bacterium]